MSEEKETIINGINVSESVLTATNNDVYYSQKAVDELQNNIKRLQQENEELKKIFKKIDKLLDEALDSEVTDMEQSLDRLYTISEMIGKVLNDRD